MAVAASDVFASIRKGPLRMYGMAPISPTELPSSKKRTRQERDEDGQAITNNDRNGTEAVHSDQAPVGKDGKTSDKITLDGSEEKSAAALVKPKVVEPTPAGESDKFDFAIDPENKGETTTEVLEPTVALHPGCFNFHDGFKGKGRMGEPRRCGGKARQCGSCKGCPLALVSPITARPGHYRLRTTEIEHDLKRWLLTTNECLVGGMEDRDTAKLLNDERFTEQHLANTLRLAIKEIQYEHQSMQHLEEFAAREPYRICFSSPIATDADMGFVKADPDLDLTGCSHSELLKALQHAANELDYLRQVSEDIAAKILKRKKNLAKFGGKTEQEALVRNGYVDAAWVDKECFL